ncbi:MAG: M28 family peptidase [Bythopirellula sp.]|nr:M28 family peptidase [Bythopirellula sp.]
MIIRLFSGLFFCLFLFAYAGAQPPAANDGFDGRRAYGYLREICSYGNRMSGSQGMKRQQELLEKHFRELGFPVEFQRFSAKHPLTGQPVPMANIIVRFFPDRQERILMAAHYDTRPLPENDVDPRKQREGVFLGANDGASGVAVLMELANHIKTLPDRYGLDFVFFDAEELVYGRRGTYFLGSEYFAKDYVKNRNYKYVAGVLLDMVGDAKLSIFQEQHSMAWEETRPIVQGIWDTAARLGVTEFIPRVGYVVQDDHLPLYRIAGIPICDVIDFHYPNPNILDGYWHTTQDTPGRCSAESLGKVGLVMLEWLRSAEE